MIDFDREFESSDIGAELLPIITQGLYSNPLDTLREYIQNGIDAGTKSIDIRISSDVISVRDYGSGMSPEKASESRRLGISLKNPMEHVGFRGIGIYSAFNVCNELNIYTKASGNTPIKVVFNFWKMKELLKEEEERRKLNLSPSQYLEKLLNQTVKVEEDESDQISDNGTLVILKGIENTVYKNFINVVAVKDYLESVVPLPFHPEFKYREIIEERFNQEDYGTIELNLKMNGKSEQLYRPYRNDVFTNLKGNKPEFKKLGNFGFAWFCFNDARKYLDSKKLRGYLIRKFNFAVGDRNYMLQYFGRAVHNNRSTGEIIVTNKNLIPNAARNDFESGALTDEFKKQLAKLASAIQAHGDKLQSIYKSEEVLAEISSWVFPIVKRIPNIERDVNGLLKSNVILTTYRNQLKLHSTILKVNKPEQYENTSNAIDQGLQQITTILNENREKEKKKASNRKKRIQQAKQTFSKAPDDEDLKRLNEIPKKIVEVAESFNIEVNDSIIVLLDYLDNEIIKAIYQGDAYNEFISELRTFLDETL
ncbi:MAG: ATP-binding protein [Calditrichaeota bacterium]|nr:ATP-binding protein [Calditrichota bacterium]